MASRILNSLFGRRRALGQNKPAARLLAAGVRVGILCVAVLSGILLNKFHPKLFVVTSGSMEPKIPQYSLILTTKKDLYYPNDVITFYANDNRTEIITHEIAQVIHSTDEKQYRTQGAANSALDGQSVRSGQIIGSLVFVWPQFGVVMRIIKETPTFLFVALLPAILFCILQSIDLVRVVTRYRVGEQS